MVLVEIQKCLYRGAAKSNWTSQNNSMMSDRESRDLLKKQQRTPTPGKRKEKRQERNESDTRENTSFQPKSLVFEEEKENECSSKPFSDPVYKRISVKNGQINKYDLSTMRRVCQEQGLDSTGKHDSVKKRLKEHFKNLFLKEAGLDFRPHRTFDYLVVVDFEATCEDKNSPDYPHEIIEFPSVLVDTRSGSIVSSWREYVRPVINPTLSEFCVSLTGITQETVDSSSQFPAVLEHFESWLEAEGLGTRFSFALVTDGPFDVGRFLRLSCQQADIVVPDWGTRWCNLRKAFANFYRGGTPASPKSPGLQIMLERLGLEFEGNPHSGLDDATNIARVAARMVKDGAQFRVNERLEENPESASPTRNIKPRLQHVVPVTKRESDSWLRSRKNLLEQNEKDEKENVGR